MQIWVGVLPVSGTGKGGRLEGATQGLPKALVQDTPSGQCFLVAYTRVHTYLLAHTRARLSESTAELGVWDLDSPMAVRSPCDLWCLRSPLPPGFITKWPKGKRMKAQSCGRSQGSLSVRRKALLGLPHQESSVSSQGRPCALPRGRGAL